MTVILARGTTQPGNVGLVTGPLLFDALTAMLVKQLPQNLVLNLLSDASQGQQ